MKCPKCGAECERDEVDNGVGMEAVGPWGCPECHWFEKPIDFDIPLASSERRPAAPTPALNVEDQLVAAAMQAATGTLVDNEPSVRFNMRMLREGFRAAMNVESGSCLVCGHDKLFAVRSNGVGVCADCRAAAASERSAPPGQIAFEGNGHINEDFSVTPIAAPPPPQGEREKAEK